MGRAALNKSSHRMLKISVIAGMIVMCGLWVGPRAQAQQNQDASSAQTRPSKITPQTMPDLGSISGNVYTDDFFGITYTFPEGWSVDTTVMDQENASTRRFLSNQNNGNEADPAVRNETYQLLMVSKFPEEIRCGKCSSVRVHGPSIRLSAGRITTPDKYQTPADLQNWVKSHFSDKGYFSVVREPSNVSFGGQVFSRMDVRDASFRGDAMAFRNGYWIEFQITADNAEELDAMFQTLNSLRFKQ